MSVRQGNKFIAGTPHIQNDNKTIAQNTENQLQAVGVIEKNKSKVKYDWVGTKKEWEDQKIANLHPDWIWYITDDYSSVATYTKQEVNELLNLKANQDLTNVNFSKTKNRLYTSVTLETVEINKVFPFTLPKELPDVQNVTCKAYALVKQAYNGYEVGDLIPLECCWGASYKSVGYWYNKTNAGFIISDQVSCSGKTDGANKSMQDYITLHLDFYLGAEI